ncbi:AAA family ATPase [Butyrivibrio sp. XPD2002]|uniref:AAA family ATPase n=1 Tax=Butyrivibrio sp. XPD2002 TaxID=1280665 RepID=UPI003FA48C33
MWIRIVRITRPRRFGKTLMMSMMENFFSIRKDSKGIFEGLAITEYEQILCYGAAFFQKQAKVKLLRVF